MPKKPKTYRRKFKRYVKRLMKNPLSKYISNQNRKIRLKLTYQVPISIQAGAAIQFPQLIVPLNYYNLCLNDNGSGAAAIDYISHNANNKTSSVYTQFLLPTNALFDTYKVQSLEVMFMPAHFDVNTLGTQLTTNGTLCVYHMNDLDDSTILAPATATQAYLNSGAFPQNFNNTSKRGVRFKYVQPKMNRKFYLNTNLLVQNKTPVATDAQTLGSGTFPNSYGSLKLLWQVLGAVPATFLGTAYITWDCIFKGIPTLI